MKSPAILILVLSFLLARADAASPVIITEFMPDNARILAAENGEFPDWIELQNTSGSPVDLMGWHLTDNSGVLTKWQFPSVTLPPGGYLVVFASGRNLTNDPAFLHTSFQLAAGGGYLALVEADGATIASAYNYPAVKEDIAFGIAQSQDTTSLLATTVPRILVPTSAGALPADWNQPGFAPGVEWTNGIAPPGVGFDTNLVAGNPVNVALSGAAAQSTVNGSFTPNLAINGSLSDFTHTLSTDLQPFWQVTLTNQMAIYSVVLFNRSSCCGSRMRDVTIEILSTNLTGTTTNFTSTLLNPENVGFAYPNGPASLSNNLVVLTGGPVIGNVVRVRRTVDTDLSGSGGQGNADEGAVLSLGEVVVNAVAAAGLRPFFNTDLKDLMLDQNASAFLHLPFTSSSTPDTLSLRVRYDDGFVAYLNGTEIARRNAPGSLAWDSTATADRSLAEASVQEDINVTSAIPHLLAGANTLSVQLLNAAASNSDAVFQPELLATRLTITTNVFFDDATPRAANTTGWYYEEVRDTRFSVARGFFEAPFSLSITSGTPDALIYVSFNADEPGPGKGFLYTNAFTITNTTVVRARAYKANWKPTDVDTASYLFLGDVIHQAANWEQTRIPPTYFPATWGANAVDYGMDPQVVTNYTPAQWKEALTQIPTLSIVTEMKNLFDATTGIYANATGHGEEWERPMSLELLDPTNAVPGRLQENGGLRIRGGASRGSSFFKHSFRLFFNRNYGAGSLKYPLFEDEGVQEFDKIDLRTSQNYSWPRGESPTFDTMVREVFGRKTLGDMGQPYRRSRYYHLYLNGQYWGLYETDERPSAYYGEAYFGGSKTNYDVVRNHDRYITPPPAFSTEATDGNLTAWSNLWVMCQMMRTNASNENYFRPLGRNADGSRNPNLPVMLDVDNLIDYMLGIFYTGDGDATLSAFLSNNQPNNWYGMRDRTNPDVGFRFFNNDCEHTLGSPSSQVDRTGPFGGSNEGNFLYSNPQWFHEQLMRNAEYRLRFADHVQKHFFNGGALTYEANTNRFMGKASQITKAIRAYSARWGDAIRTTQPYGESDWTNAIAFCMNWFTNRGGIVLAQLRADALVATNSAAAFSQPGGSVPAGFQLELAHTNATGTILYTTDGSDPRLVGGGVSPSAQAYNGALTINFPVTIRARVLTGAAWSALIEHVFFPLQNLDQLRVTEIMYNPPAFGLIDGDEVEFLELKNTGTNTLNLTGLRFTSGIDYAFPFGTTLAPGAFYVLAANSTHFTNKYPGVTVNGVYGGQIINSGETLALSHLLGGKVLSVTYDDQAPWPLTPDNHGFSLVPVAPNDNPNPDDAANWRASTFVGGSPGADDPANAVPTVLINEVLNHSETGTDFVELFNPNAFAVAVGGWFLTDDAGIPKKFRLPADATIEPMSFLLFTEADFNATPGTNLSFALQSYGDDVYLFSGDATTNLTGYSHGFSFGASPDGGTFGRYVISTGEEHFPAQLAATPGLPNVGPLVGPVVLNEIHYHPGTGGDEFIELKNITTNAVAFYDTERPTNTWRLNGLGYDFPTNVTLEPGAFALIVATNPAVFRAQYNIPESVLILGPYDGSLQDNGERLELQRPDVPDTNGVVFITVDEVRYNDRAPWPVAGDGSGASLQRLASAAYGNDPANWTAAVPTPGADFPGGPAPAILTQPQSQVGLFGSNVLFSVSASGTPPLRYAWRFNGNLIPGQTGSTLALNAVTYAQAGSYSVLVFNDAGSVASAAATLTVIRLPVILQNPANQYPRPGSNAVFSVGATGSGFLRYQWQFNGVNLPNQTNASLVVTNAQFASVGLYTVVLTDNIGASITAPALLDLAIDPIITQNPVSQTMIAGTPVTLSLSVTNTATLPIGYRIRRNGSTLATTIPGAYVTLNERTVYFTFSGTNTMPPWTNYAIIATNLAKPSGNLSLNATLTYQTDGDGDGLADQWETNFFGTSLVVVSGEDTDGDGMTNGQEYQAGTNPTDASSYLKINSITATGGATLTFGAISNRTYSVQYNDVPGGVAWTKLLDVPARATNRVETIADPTASTNRFYRLATPQQAGP